MATETLLITPDDIRQYYSLGKNMSGERVEPHILRAQQSDLKPFLGQVLYWDIFDKPTEPKYIELLEGTEYTLEGKTVFFGGINQLLASWAYARVMHNNNDFVTRGGNKSKATPESEAMGNPITQTRMREAESEAIRLQGEAFVFLDENRTVYDLWDKYVTSTDSPTRQSMNITKVGFSQKNLWR